MKKITLLILLLGIYFNSYSQTDTININNIFYSSQTIYRFMPNKTIYGLRINGRVSYSFNDYTSLARVILVNSDSTELLIYEAYPWLFNNGNWSFYFSNAGDETYYLDAMSVSYIKVELFNAKIDTITMLIDTVYNSNIPTWRTLYIDSLRQNKIDSINNNIQKHKLLWVAGDNPVAQMTFNNKKRIFANDLISTDPFNTFGDEYYIGGIFSVIGATIQSPTRSNFVESFDWRNRHSQDWITSVKDQDTVNMCEYFSLNAIIEAVINLYYNSHINIDLSEQAYFSCSYRGIFNPTIPPLTLCHTPEIPKFCIVRELGALEEDCYPFADVMDFYGYYPDSTTLVNIYTNPPNWPNGYVFCKDLCLDYANKFWKIDDYHFISGFQPDIDSLKKNIILKGPIHVTRALHSVAIVGFGTVNFGDTLYIPTTPYHIVVDSNYLYLIGATYFIEKDSQGINYGENGYGKKIYNFCQGANVCANWFVSINTPITPSINSGLTTDSIKCKDNDGDGYYWWGIGAKPSTCPVFAPNERDCDDSDPLVGTYDNEYNCTPICLLDPVNKDITGLTINQNEYMTNPIITVKSGHTLKIENHATLFIHPSTQIIVENGAELDLDNGNIKVCSDAAWQGNIIAGTGAIVKIEHESVFINNNISKWMPLNMNVGTMINSSTNQSDNSTIEKYCYGDIQANCELYGGLYQWGEAMQYAASVNCDPCGPTTGHGGVQGICPTGFHIPSDLEWSRYEWRMENYISPKGTTSLSTFQNVAGFRGSTTAGVGPGDKMKATSNNIPAFDGTNTSGFNAVPGGNFPSNIFYGIDVFGNFWSASEYINNNNFAWYRKLNLGVGNSARWNYSKSAGFSVRCLKDQ